MPIFRPKQPSWLLPFALSMCACTAVHDSAESASVDPALADTSTVDSDAAKTTDAVLDAKAPEDGLVDVTSVSDAALDAGETSSDAIPDITVPADSVDVAEWDAAEAIEVQANSDISGLDAAVDTTTACTCGDGFCDSSCGESLTTCPIDCAVCKDGVCSPGEGPANCPEDCCGGCGDGKCVGYSCGENPDTCKIDCGTACGNKVCDKGESPSNCATDCKTQVCGNGVCEPEDLGPASCPQDCGTACGDCVCVKGESFESCPVDCGFCGDGVCSLCAGLGETMNTCPSDCKAGGCGKGCDDQVACTVDICASDGGCAHISDLTACDDANFCTVDACGPAGCTHTPSLGNCDDSNACTVYDQCIAGACQPGAAKSCDDGNPCTTDTCAPESGCVHTGLAAGATCGSGICSTSGQCAVPPSGMVLVPGGTFWMGCNATKDKNCAADEKPQHKVTVSPFFMNTTEVTGSQYLACVDAGACKEPVVGCSGAAFVSINWDASAAMPKAGRAQHPVNCIDWDQARAYCQWLGAGHDLPTEAQWEFAARGSCEKNKSSATDPGCAATMRTHPWGEQTPTCDLAILNSSVGLDCGGQNTAAVGIVPGGASPYGLQDMSGNVSEWVRDAYASFGASAASDPFVAGTATDKRAVRGSSFKVAAIWPEARAGARKSATVTVAYSTVGVRCVAALP